MRQEMRGCQAKTNQKKTGNIKAPKVTFNYTPCKQNLPGGFVIANKYMKPTFHVISQD